MGNYDFGGAQGNVFQIESSGTQINNISYGKLQQDALTAASALDNSHDPDARRVANELRAEAAKPEGEQDRKWMLTAIEWAKVLVPALIPMIGN